MFIGTYRHSVDEKNRMRVPPKFKIGLGSTFIITKGTGKNLYAFSKEQFDALYNKLVNLPLFDEEAQKPIRKFLSSAFEAEEDGQGRILLPKELLAHAGINKNLVSVGVGSRIEIWAEEVWESNSSEDVDFGILGKLGV